MDDPNPLQDEIKKLKEDVHVLRERLAKLNADLAKAAWTRRGLRNRRGRSAADGDQPNPGRRASDAVSATVPVPRPTA